MLTYLSGYLHHSYGLCPLTFCVADQFLTVDSPSLGTDARFFLAISSIMPREGMPELPSLFAVGPIAVTPVLWWMEAGAPRSARLPQLTLHPHSTTSLPVDSLLVQAGLKNFNGSFNLILETEAKPGALLLDSGSVDHTNTYVFEVIPQAIGESMAKSLSYLEHRKRRRHDDHDLESC